MAERTLPSKKKINPQPIAVRRGPKPKKTAIASSALSEVRHFQAMFSPYFPHLATDFDTAGFEMDWLYTRVVGNPFDTVRRSKAKAELAKIGPALKLLGRHNVVYWGPLVGMIMDAKKNGDKLAPSVDEILKFLLVLDQMQEEGTLDKVISKFISGALTAIEQIPEQGNTHWTAVHAVEGLRILWWRNTGLDGPSRALNPASPFAGYLRDGFEFLEIQANPEAAFKRWVAAYPK